MDRYWLHVKVYICLRGAGHTVLLEKPGLSTHIEKSQNTGAWKWMEKTSTGNAHEDQKLFSDNHIKIAFIHGIILIAWNFSKT